MSVIPLKAEINQRGLHVRLMPLADGCAVRQSCRLSGQYACWQKKRPLRAILSECRSRMLPGLKTFARRVLDIFAFRGVFISKPKPSLRGSISEQFPTAASTAAATAGMGASSSAAAAAVAAPIDPLPIAGSFLSSADHQMLHVMQPARRSPRLSISTRGCLHSRQWPVIAGG